MCCSSMKEGTSCLTFLTCVLSFCIAGSSGVDAGSFHGKSEKPRQALQNLRGRRTSERINKKDKRNAPVTITIDDDSESELEQVSLF
jgi:hypothetical protein